jgi:hypothetical protein
MPAKQTSPLPPDDGPAIQMDPLDHGRTSSNGQRPGSAQYRKMIQYLLDQGKWREAMAIEIADVRKIAREIGDARKYNQALKEMLEYFHCLEKHGLF